MQHLYIDNRYTDEQVSQMQSCDGPSKNYYDVLSQDELKILQEQITKIQYPETGKTSKYAGASYKDPQGKIIKDIFNDKLEKIIGDHDLDFFAWQEAINPWKIHADLRWYPDKLPYKVVLFPIDVISDKKLGKTLIP